MLCSITNYLKPEKPTDKGLVKNVRPVNVAVPESLRVVEPCSVMTLGRNIQDVS